MCLLLALSAFALAAFGDTGGTAAASIMIVGGPAARLTLSPDRAINAVGEPHVLTVHLEITDGYSWEDAAGETIDIRIVSGVGWLSPGPYVTDAKGLVEITLYSDDPGLIVVEASWEGIVEEEAVSGSDMAEKEYIEVGARLMLEPDGENVVGDAHVFTAHLEIYEGEQVGWVDGGAEVLDVAILSGPGWLSAGPYITDENGEVEITHETDRSGVTTVQATWNGTVVDQAITATDTAEKTWTQPPSGAGGEAFDCRGRCPPPIPALYATKRSDLVVDVNGNEIVDAGDTVRYTMLVTNFATVPMDGVQYVEAVDPNARLVADSWQTGRGQLAARDFDGTEVLVGSIGSLLPDEAVLFSYDVIVNEDLDPTVAYLVSQGTLFADTTSPVVTDDPSTEPIHDATRMPIGSVAGGGGSLFEEGSSEFLKEANVVEPNVLRVVSPGGAVDYVVKYRNDTGSTLTDVRLVDIVGPYFFVQTYSSTRGEAALWTHGDVKFVVADFDEVAPGETAEVEYRAQAQLLVPIEVSHTAARGLVASRDVETCYTDDPLTDLRGDATCVLFPYRCDYHADPEEEGAWTWEDWRKVVSEAPTCLFPLVMREKDGTEHVRWVLYGGDFFGDLSVEPSTRPANWSQWALVGLVELGFEDVLEEDPGFRLAQREEPYVEAFLAEEPFFMWQDYDMPLYGRVPATDAGELLHCEGIVRELCDHAYLPLLVELDWSRDWDMRWLEDDLIVATVIPEERLR